MKAKTMCECLTISQAALFKRLTTTSLNHLTQHMPLYPQKAVVEKQILNRNIWDNYKKQLINDILLQSKRNRVKLIRNSCTVSNRSNRAFRSHQDSQTEKAAIAKRRDCSWVKPERVRVVPAVPHGRLSPPSKSTRISSKSRSKTIIGVHTRHRIHCQ